uniref:THAP domain-containing protein 1 n=1 Tax=Myripristis murdjan TaxID=586833 RepID=A0A667WXU8_9TELE
MVIFCCAVQCANRQGCKPNLAFYRIPFDADRRRRWVAAINRKDWQPSKYSRICSEHFFTRLGLQPCLLVHCTEISVLPPWK